MTDSHLELFLFTILALLIISFSSCNSSENTSENELSKAEFDFLDPFRSDGTTIEKLVKYYN